MEAIEPEKRWCRRWRWMLIGALLCALGIVLLAFGWSERVLLLEQLEVLRTGLLGWMQSVPVPVFILAFIIGPAVGVPLTFFYLATGAVVGNLFLSLLLAWTCIFLNVLLSYGIARSFLHPVIERAVRSRGFSIPVIPREDEWKLILMLRVSPIPWLFQNYLLALGGVRLVPFLIISMLAQAPIGAGMIIVGESLFAGSARYALLGVFVFLTASFGFSLLRRRMEKAKRRPDEPAAA